MVAPHTFFEALGVRYAGPIDGHDVEHMEQAFTHAAEWDGPDRGARPDPEGPRLRAGRGGRHPAPARREGVQGRHAREHGRQLGRAAVGGSAGSDSGGVARPGRRPPPTTSPRRATTYTEAFSRALLAAEEDAAWWR